MSHVRHTIETEETSDWRIISLKTTSSPWIAKKAYQKFSDLENTCNTLHNRFDICGCQSSKLYERTPTSIISFFILFFIKRDRASLWGNMSVHFSISPYFHWYLMSERIYGPSLTLAQNDKSAKDHTWSAVLDALLGVISWRSGKRAGQRP